MCELSCYKFLYAGECNVYSTCIIPSVSTQTNITCFYCHLKTGKVNEDILFQIRFMYIYSIFNTTYYLYI